MHWIALCVICTNIAILQAKHELNINKLIQIIRRRNSQSSPILGAPQYPEHLPEAESMLPGHTLLRPAGGTLKSAIKYPLRDTGGSLVYGNTDNIGIAGEKNQRVLYSNFRKSTNLLAALGSAIRKLLKKNRRPQRRHYKHHSGPILGAPKYPEDLPEAEPILPGHTLLRPARGTLKSAVKYPLRDTGDSLVYGNVANIGIANDKRERVLYTNFRKTDVLAAIASTIREYNKQHTRPEVYIPKAALMVPKKKSTFDSVVTHTDEENDARETIDEFDPDRVFFDLDDEEVDFRRKRKSKSKYRHRSVENSGSGSEDSSSASSEYERNPGNPYTIHKNKYKQNWIWNHYMDGDHMNINPYGPPFKTAGPSGADLMFGRKWWYFNQDDYKPMG